MSLQVNAVRPAAVPSPASVAAAPAARTTNAVDVIGSAMLSRMQDGFDGPSTKASTAPAAAPKKKKKKKGLFSKIGGFLKKALPMVSKIAGFIPGLSSIT